MPQFILHRVNTVTQLEGISDLNWGCEVDLRSDVSRPGEMHLSHDPWKKGEDFATWLKAFSKKGLKGTLILNTKEDGLEEKGFELMKAHKIENFFFLDTALPTLVKWTGLGHRQFALRLSKHEPPESVGSLAKRLDWVWIDCFDREPIPSKWLKTPTLMGTKSCLVSPELQGGSADLIGQFKELGTLSHSICTKIPAQWLMG